MAISGDIFGCHNWEKGVLVASEERTGMLLKILQSSGQSPKAKYYPVQSFKSIEVKKSPTLPQVWVSLVAQTAKNLPAM